MGLFKAFETWTFSDFATFVGGFFILGSIIFEAFKKATEHTEWAKKRQAEKMKVKKEAAHEQYKEFTNEFSSVQKLWDTFSSIPKMKNEFKDIPFKYKSGNIEIKNVTF